MPSLYMINPRPNRLNYDTAPGFVSMPDLAMITVASMAPRHWHVSVCEEAVDEIDLDTPARFVGLTGKNAQLPRMIELAGAFRQRGKIVLIGGPVATLDPEALRPHADILVTGEIEDLYPRLFADLEAGVWENAYDGGRADIRKSPIPRWDLYPVESALMGALQTTRGCPFECEFCDVIQYNGRKQRHKDMDQILRELDALYLSGFRQVFLTDDNFTVHRPFARATLEALAKWNEAHGDDRVHFVTQASIDIARDTDILELAARAGLDHLFIGIETVNPDSLRETKKRQNLLMSPREAIDQIVSRGVLVRNGIIIGFDHDGPNIFNQLYDFLQSSPLPMPVINVLIASKSTPLYDRLHQEGRLIDQEQRWDEHMRANFTPKLMSLDALTGGAFDLARQLFTPAAFEQRTMNMISMFGSAMGSEDPAKHRGQSARGPRGAYAISRLRRLSARGVKEAAMVSRLLNIASTKPGCLRGVITCLVFFEQYRTYFDDVDQRLAAA